MDQDKKRAVVASAVGTFIEWYDFFLYGTASALVFNKLFFPQFDPRIGTLLALLTYATGFLARPLGGLISGHFGDRFGRKNVLLGTLFAMGGATFLMGCLPTYDVVGIWGAVALVGLRIVQGFAAGGEWSGALVLVAETVGEQKRGLWGSVLTSVNQAAFIVGAMILTLVNSLTTDQQFLTWGWRVPFLLSALMVVVGIYIRLRVSESPEFIELEKRNETVATPIKEIPHHWRNVLSVLAIRVGETTYYYMLSVFAISYAVGTLHLSRGVVLDALILGAGLAVGGSLVGGVLADRFGARRVMLFGFLFQLGWIVPFFLLYRTLDPLLVTVATALGILVVNSAIDAPQAKLFAPMFPANIRYSGVAAGREIATNFSGFTPALASALLGADGSPWSFAGFLLLCTVLGLIGLVCARPVTAGSATASAGTAPAGDLRTALPR